MSSLPDIYLCDVEDKEALAEFRTCRSRWYEWLIGNDQHSIATQLTTMVWDDAIFRTLYEVRRLTDERPSSNKGFNSDLLDLLSRGFITSQVMAIRRLTDPEFSDPSKSVVSLSRLLADIQRHHQLLTRENYICFDGMLFEAALGDSDQRQTFQRDQMNRTFDVLSNTTPTSRSRKDLIQESRIQDVVKSLDVCKNFRNYANKFIAHAAVPSNARSCVREEIRIAPEMFDQAYRAIVRAASFVSLGILFERGGLGDIPTPQYNHLENLDKPMILPSEADHLDIFWHTRVSEMEKWSENVF